MSNFNDFLTGITQTLNPNTVSQWALRNIAGGKYYDPYNDPGFLQDYQIAQRLGTDVARNDFNEKYRQYLGRDMFQDPLSYQGMQDYSQINQYLTGLMNNRAGWDQINQEIGNINDVGFDFNIDPVLYQNMYTNLTKGDRITDYNTMSTLAGNLMQGGLTPAEQEQWSNFGYTGSPADYYQPRRYSDIELLGMGARQLTPEQLQQYEGSGQLFNTVEGYDNWYFPTGELPQEPDPSADYQRKATIAQNMYADDKSFGDNDLSVWQNVLGYEGSPADYYSYAQPEQRPDYSSLGMDGLVQNIMLDGQVSPVEEEIWASSPYSAFGNVEDIHNAMQPVSEINWDNIDIAAIASRKLMGQDVSDLIQGYNENMPGTELDITPEMVDTYIAQNQPQGARTYDLTGIANREGVPGDFSDIEQGNVDDIIRAIVALRPDAVGAAGSGSGSGNDLENQFGLTEYDKWVMDTIYGGEPADNKFNLLDPPVDEEGYIIDRERGQRWINPFTGQPYDTTPEGNIPLENNGNFLDFLLPSNGTGWFSDQPKQQNQQLAQNNNFNIPDTYTDTVNRYRQAGQGPQASSEAEELYQRLSNLFDDVNSPIDAANKVKNMPESNQQILLNRLNISLDDLLNSLQALHSKG